MYLNLILTVIVLKAYERMNLADALSSKTYTSGSVIIQQGDPADGMYFVETGEVSVTVVGNDGSERQVCKKISKIISIFRACFISP